MKGCTYYNTVPDETETFDVKKLSKKINEGMYIQQHINFRNI